MAMKRTTISVDADLLAEIKRQALDLHCTVSKFFQDSARERLARIQEGTKPFRLEPVDTGGYQRGVDISDNAALLDFMERPGRFQPPTFDLGAPKPGVDLNDNAGLLEFMECDGVHPDLLNRPLG